MITTAGLLLIKDQKLLLAYSNNKKAYYLPGGKVDPGETTLEGLCREIKEELNLTLNPEWCTFYSHVQAMAYGEEPPRVMEQDCFLYPEVDGFEASAEIGDLKFFSTEEYAKEQIQVEGVKIIMDQLKLDGKMI